ncbi:MAG: hypothetical protein FGM61_01975 [Sediminibacterium sp.]|nr:hypothetical protein [Sediminibacterium sp.]
MEEKQHIQQELQELSPELIGLSRRMPFSVPDAYFSNLTHRIREMADPVFPVGTLGNGRPFSVPDNYFQELSGKIQERAGTIESQSGATVFKLNIVKWMPYAAAAVLGGVLVYTAFLFNNPRINTVQLQPTTDYTAMENPIPSHTILTPDNEVYRAIAQKMTGISDEEMNTYLEETVSSETTEWIPEEMN